MRKKEGGKISVFLRQKNVKNKIVSHIKPYICITRTSPKKMALLPYFYKSIDFYVVYRVECIIDKKYKENL